MGSTGQDLSNSRRGKRKHGNRSPSIVDWNTIDSSLIREVVRMLARSGGAVRFGYTRDQGAFAIGIYGEGDPYTEYFHSPDECAEFLKEIIRDYANGDEQSKMVGV